MTWSSASPPMSVSISPPPNRRSLLPRPSRESLPAWPKSSSAPAPPVRASLSAPPNRRAAGSAPLVSLRLSTSLPASPKTRICEVLATVGVPPATVTPPLLTRIVPAASRLIWMSFAVLSPITVSTPALNVAVVAALAVTLVTAMAPAPIAVPASSRRVADPRRACRAFIVFSSGQRRGFHRRCMAVLSLAAANRFAASRFNRSAVSRLWNARPMIWASSSGAGPPMCS